MNKFFILFLISLFFYPLDIFAAGYATGGFGTEILIKDDQITIVVRMELWGEGVWNDPSLATHWQQIIEKVWNNQVSGSRVKYKCYDVFVDVEMKISPQTRQGSSASSGTPGYHQIWVPEVRVGDMANTYNQYGLYLPDQGTRETAYGELDPETAKEYYEKNTTTKQRESGKGKISGFIWDPRAIGKDAQKEATWGTLPNSLTDSVVAHEFGHLIGVSHDEKNCQDNVMSPSNGKFVVRTQVYPRYFKEMFDPLGLSCEWNIEGEIHMDATGVGTYFPVRIDASHEFILKEEPAAKGYIAVQKEESAELIYDFIEPNFTCNIFDWLTHNGKLKYEAELFYNFKEDLEEGGRLLLFPSILTDPYEEIRNISGCGSGSLTDLSMVNPVNHHNILYSLTGKNLEVTPYNYQFEKDVSCPARPEDPFIEQYYVDGVMIDGASKGSEAKYFPSSNLFGAQFDYKVKITDTTPFRSQAEDSSSTPVASQANTSPTTGTSTENETFNSVDEILKAREQALGEDDSSKSSSSSNTSNNSIPTDQKKVVDFTDSLADNNLSRYTGDDGMIEQHAKYLQQTLWVSFFTEGLYPEELSELDLTGVDLTGITYVPKGEKPYQDYELHVEFSQEIEIYHPLQ